MKSKHKIQSLKGREVLDSRGNPTVEVELKTDSVTVQAQVPSGASTGKYEAVELRDGGKRYFGKGTLKAIENINEVIASKVKGMDVVSQKEIDNLMVELDGTKDKSHLGANAICGVSLAVCRAGAAAKNLKLFEYIKDLSQNTYKIPDTNYKIPIPLFNVINGGAHAGNELDIQEFMVAPKTQSFSENLKVGSEIYHQLKDILLKRYGRQAINLGDEGGFAPPLVIGEQAIELILVAVKALNYQDRIKIVLDVAASQFFEQGKYKMKTGVFTKEGLTRYYSNLISKYPILGIEDPFSEDDWEGFKKMSRQFGEKILIIGDDLLVTNTERIREAKEKEAVNAMIVKINQIGTVSETMEAVKLAKEFGWKIIVSHRSGETQDSFIADFAVGIGADFIKTGAPARGERIVKYNRLLKIEESIAR